MRTAVYSCSEWPLESRVKANIKKEVDEIFVKLWGSWQSFLDYLC